MNVRHCLPFLLCLLAAGLPRTGAAAAADAARPGQPQLEQPTLHSLGVRWPIPGDANGNAVVHVSFRAAGESGWRTGLPLLRTAADKLSPGNAVPGGTLFAGSIFDLRPGTDYEIRLRLEDPDGGGTTRLLAAATRAEPALPRGMRVRHVMPAPPRSARTGPAGGGRGTADDPFRGLAAAAAAAAPGDLFLLAPGIYRGPVRLRRAGTAARPIVFRGRGDGPAVLDGGGAAALLDLAGLRHVWIEGLTFRNARMLVRATDSADLVLRRNRFQVTYVGVGARGALVDETRRLLITDNRFVGTNSWPRVGKFIPVYAVNLTGAGHVVAYNHIRNVADGIHNGSHGRLRATDIHNNEIEICTDDGIETDYADSNLRVFRNRITNCFVGISGQPVHGGPVYVYRNLIFNTQFTPFKLHNHTAGLLLFHNTSIRAGSPFPILNSGETVTDVMTRNNLFIGTDGPALRSTGRMIRCDFDNDGYGRGWHRGPFALWNGTLYRSAAAATASRALYARHGAVTIAGYRLFEPRLLPPTDYRLAYPAAMNRPLLRPDAAAVDAGVRLANMNEDFRGRAPDLGCCELGAPLPHFGPRP